MLRVLEESTFNLLLSISSLETSLSLSDGVDRELCFVPPSSLTWPHIQTLSERSWFCFQGLGPTHGHTQSNKLSSLPGVLAMASLPLV